MSMNIITIIMMVMNAAVDMTTTMSTITMKNADADITIMSIITMENADADIIMNMDITMQMMYLRAWGLRRLTNSVRRGAADFTGRVCVIGSNLEEDKIKELFKVS